MVMYLLSVAIEKKYQPIIKGFTRVLLLVPNFAISDGIQKFANKASQIRTWETMNDKEKDFRRMVGHACSGN